MLACLDVHYSDSFVRAAAVVFENWSSTAPRRVYSVDMQGAERYESGKFYRRELQPLLNLIQIIEEPIQLYIIDAYCYLSDERLPGLGVYLYKALNRKIPVVGVAKNKFKQTDIAEEVYRGGSEKPLFVTSVGISPKEAARDIAVMAGDFRIPDLLKLVDRKARER